MKSNWSKHKPTMFPPAAFYLMALVALVIVFIMEDLGSKIADVFRVEDSEVARDAGDSEITGRILVGGDSLPVGYGGDVFVVSNQADVAAVASEPMEIKAGQTWVRYDEDPFTDMPYRTNHVLAISNGYVKYKNCYGDESVSTEWFFQIDSTLKEVK